jgi:hypothetical protein
MSGSPTKKHRCKPTYRYDWSGAWVLWDVPTYWRVIGEHWPTVMYV